MFLITISSNSPCYEGSLGCKREKIPAAGPNFLLERQETSQPLVLSFSHLQETGQPDLKKRVSYKRGLTVSQGRATLCILQIM